jgi:hypothetical protein
VKSLTSVLQITAWQLLRGSLAPFLAATLAGIAAWLATRDLDNPAAALAIGVLLCSALYALLTLRQGKQLLADVRALLEAKGAAPSTTQDTSPESAVRP